MELCTPGDASEGIRVSLIGGCIYRDFLLGLECIIGHLAALGTGPVGWGPVLMARCAALCLRVAQLLLQLCDIGLVLCEERVLLARAMENGRGTSHLLKARRGQLSS